MKQRSVLSICAMLVVLLASCEKQLTVEGADEGNSVLNVVTRSGEQDSKVSYPVTVYVMNVDGQCVRRQQLLSATDQLELKLQPLTYNIYAVGGATDGDYSLPGQDDAVATSEVSLNVDAVHGDLMTASNSISLTAFETTTLTLSMKRRVMEIESLVIKDVPQQMDAVSVTLSPLYDDMLLNGTYTTGTSAETIALTMQPDGTTWANAAETYLLPSSGNATITVRFSRGGSVKSYAYTCPQPLEANKHVRITGTFTGSDELTLKGVITGASWDGTTTIDFSFDETGAVIGSTDTTGGNDSATPDPVDDPDVMQGAAPAVNTLYKGCYVLSKEDDAAGQYTLVTLIHPQEEALDGSIYNDEELQAKLDEVLPLYDINGITNWRLPTLDELKKVSIGSVTSAFNKGGMAMRQNRYFFQDGDEVMSAFVSSTVTAILDHTNGDILRPFTTVKFRK